MARDYKNRSSRKNGGSRVAGLVTFIAGLVTGLCVAIGFVLVKGLPDLLSTNDKQQPVVITTAPGKDERQKGTEQSSEQAAKKTADSAPPSPRFDFYTILPEMEVSVPEWESETSERGGDENTAAETGPVSSPDEAESYILQIGSFREPDEAERVKAQLAMLGITTEVQRVVIDGGDVWHRVRAGPYDKADELKQTRQRLIENDIDFMLLRLKQDTG
ncbi:cell division protein FtsN [Methylohalomonas lacus]|uniref:Cell division protein FtsN n=1 Tax=Methylohalomonas lacus TaxID=398773 RepID=A0AAE3HKR6_9GAMM|nr:SPOR domain-containing protein [Methylohalomonas lacus]MCS3904146.1 cell division protein FtsN [Methylohalomonas lacus]